MIWCVDGWYSDEPFAESMREFYLDEAGATEAHIVRRSTHGGFGIAYAVDEAVIPWHADPRTA